MRILVISDLEDSELDLSLLEDPQIRLIVSCGDVYNRTHKILRAKTELPILAVHGNHDDVEWPEGIEDLHLRVVTRESMTFGGFQGAWRYKPKGHFLYDDDEVREGLRSFPRVDVFVAHNPMAGAHEVDDDVHRGFMAFREYVEARKPRLFLHGHSNTPGEVLVGDTRVICVCRSAIVDI